MTIEELNIKYFNLFGQVFECRGYLPERQLHVMTSNLMAEYERELRVIVGEAQLASAEKLYSLNYRLKKYIPRSFLFFSNKIAQVYKRQLKAEFLKELQLQQEKAEVAEKTTTKW